MIILNFVGKACLERGLEDHSECPNRNAKTVLLNCFLSMKEKKNNEKNRF